MTLTRAPAARRPYFMSPHMTQPSLGSSFHPQPPTGETSLGQLTHFSITHYSVEHGEGEMGNCLPELDESSPSKMFLLLPTHLCCLYFTGGLSLTAWATMVWTPVHHTTLLFKSNILLAPLPWSPRQPHRLPLTLGFRRHILENSKPLDPQWIFRRLSPSVFPVLMLFLHSSSQLILGRVEGAQHLGRNIFYLDSPQPLTCSYWTNKKSKHNHPSQRAQESLQTLNYH